MGKIIDAPKIGYYVNEGGNICDINDAIKGCYFLFEEKPSYTSVLIVITKTDEIHDEYVLWNSIEELKAAIS